MRHTLTAPPAIQRERLLQQTITLIAWGGVPAATLPAVSHAAGVDARTVARQFGSMPRLLLRATRAVAADPFIPVPARLAGGGGDADALLAHLADGHRLLVDAEPQRYSALLQITSTALLGRYELVGPIAARQRRLNAQCEEHFRRLRGVGGAAPDADLRAAARLFVEGLTGVAMIHDVDRDAAARAAAHHELCAMVAVRLTYPPAR